MKATLDTSDITRNQGQLDRYFFKQKLNNSETFLNLSQQHLVLKCQRHAEKKKTSLGRKLPVTANSILPPKKVKAVKLVCFFIKSKLARRFCRTTMITILYRQRKRQMLLKITRLIFEIYFCPLARLISTCSKICY